MSKILFGQEFRMSTDYIIQYSNVLERKEECDKLLGSLQKACKSIMIKSITGRGDKRAFYRTA